MKCSICGGEIISLEHLVYRSDGSTTGEYKCQKCGASKTWYRPGYKKDLVIDMS